MQAVIYARYSSDSQAPLGGASPLQQRRVPE